MAWRVLEKLQPRQKIGDVLIEMGLLTQADIDLALTKVKPGGPRLGTLLVNNAIITQEQLAKALSAQFSMEYLDLEDIVPTAEALKCLPENVAREQVVLPLSLEKGVLSLAVFDPLNVINIQTVSRITKYELNVKVSQENQIRKAIDVAYSKGDRMANIVKELTKENSKTKPANAVASTGANLTLVEKNFDKVASIESLVNMILGKAISDGASDIHIEPDESFLRIRERVDGVLREVSTIPLELAPALVSRLKILSDLDFAERRISQDGRFRLNINNRVVDLRISTLPTLRGEKIVLRILDKSALSVQLDEVGLLPPTLSLLKKILAAPFGIILVTGPTGSGKSTTVYSMLNHLNSVEKNIITVEDPVEYQFGLINQVQVQPKIGFTFASVLRSILRQDPDIIMVGEIRDRETAEITIRAALTGHLVITTLHTNNAVSTIMRLIDMGIDPSLISSSLLGIVSQRLVRKVCPFCKKQQVITEIDELRLAPSALKKDSIISYGSGCKMCLNFGLKGRTPVFELLVPDDFIRKAIIAKQSEDELLDYLKKTDFKTMREDGVAKVLSGLTVPSEVIKATVADE